jgi:hypothetical protein
MLTYLTVLTHLLTSPYSFNQSINRATYLLTLFHTYLILFNIFYSFNQSTLFTQFCLLTYFINSTSFSINQSICSYLLTYLLTYLIYYLSYYSLFKLFSFINIIFLLTYSYSYLLLLLLYYPYYLTYLTNLLNNFTWLSYQVLVDLLLLVLQF